MAKKPKNNSKRLKTSKKKALLNRKIVNQRVSYSIAHLNKAIDTPHAHTPKTVQAQSISFDQLRKLIDGPGKSNPPKLKIEEVDPIRLLLAKWGENYARAAKDIKRNKMQWTAKQIEKKAQAYRIMLQEEAQEQP